MRIRARLALVLLVLAMPAAGVRAEDPPPADPEWVAAARTAKLTDGEIKRLRGSSITLTRTEDRQVFTAYIEGGAPPFVTTDSIRAAYDVLLEASVARLEGTRAAELPSLLRATYDALGAVPSDATLDASLREAAESRARRVLAVALRLVGEPTPGLPPEDEAAVAEEVRAAEGGQGLAQPEWLAPFDDAFAGIDHDSFRPRGLCEGDASLARHFRAVRWLQSVPFRAAVPAEAAAWKRLHAADVRATFGEAVPSSWTEGRLGTFAAAFVPLVGAPRSYGPAGSTTLRDGPRDFVLPAGDAPENAAFRFVTAEPSPRRAPDGLDVGVALGSSYAARVAQGAPRPLLGELAQSKQESLAAQHRRMLAALVDEPEPDAPAFLGNDAWRAKGLASALAGWSAFRHATVLSTEESATYLCAAIVPAGFVEPEPVFYERLAELSEATLRFFGSARAFEGRLARIAVREDLEQAARWLLGTGDPERRHPVGRVDRGFDWANALGVKCGPYELPKEEPARAESAAKLAAEMRRLAASLPDPLPRAIASQFELADRKLTHRWQWLASTAWRLAAMSQRQLRGVAWSEDDEAFLRGYGERLAFLMLYDGNCWATPRDDAPQTASVHTLADEAGRRSSLHVSVGRPRRVYVLWPAGGKDVLCVGSVLPYHETTEDRRLTDAEWRARFPEGDTTSRPPLPAWTAPLTE